MSGKRKKVEQMDLPITLDAVKIFFRSNWAQLSRELPKGAALPKWQNAAQVAYDLYANTFHSQFRFFILGGPELRKCDPQMSPKEKERIDLLWRNMAICSSRPEEKGAVFFEKQWFLPINDYWMAAAIQAGKEFHLYTKKGKTPSDLLWDKQDKRPRVLGRELLMLKAAGYTLIDHEHSESMGLVFACTDATLAQSMTIEKLRGSIEAYNLKDILKMFDSELAVSYKDYDTPQVFKSVLFQAAAAAEVESEEARSVKIDSSICGGAACEALQSYA